ncbi:MAG: hypothetical protein IPM82_06320 [Saprospiraceae bacterium]|nr:hypothetical protein [Saprospiraceae bacterium]
MSFSWTFVGLWAKVGKRRMGLADFFEKKLAIIFMFAWEKLAGWIVKLTDDNPGNGIHNARILILDAIKPINKMGLHSKKWVKDY